MSLRSTLATIFRPRFLIVGALIGGALFFAPMAGAQLLDPVCEDTPQATVCQENTPQSHGDNRIYGPNGILTRVAKIISYIVGITSVIVVIIGGLKYITSNGDPKTVNSAKDTVLYAMVGLIVTGISQGIIIFVLNKL